MIYYFSVRIDDKDKTFYFTAESRGKLYRRILDTYGITKDYVTILREYEETEGYGYKLVEETVKEPEVKVKKKVIDKARELFKNQKRRSGSSKEDYANRHKCKIIDIESEKDLYDLIGKYKFIKVCWEPGEKRGQHKYYVFVK